MSTQESIQGTEIRTIQTDCFVGKHHHKNREIHQHNCIEMSYVLKGEAIHILKKGDNEETKTPLKAGNYIIIDYETAHGFADGSNDFLVINFLFHPTFISPELSESHSFEKIVQDPMIGFDYSMLTHPPVNHLFYDDDRQILTIFEKAYKAFTKNATGHFQLLRCYAIEIMIAALQQLLITIPIPKSNSVISSICDYIDEHYMEQITLTKICHEKYFSIPYISKKFKKVCGVSFEQYLQQVRVQHACSLLLETNFTVDTIASYVNYTDTASFRKAFKKLTGKSPSEFRKIYTQQN
ncbi:MAG: helix-turn-helix domain-containing protein [Clostridia bacterium]|nr:helix-turn-helix domain-containing protein [Clostridia bacterium]